MTPRISRLYPIPVCILAVWAVLICALPVDAKAGLALYVAVDGDDTNPGTRKKPFATLERARDAIRELKQSGPPKGPVRVWIRGGVYPRTETFQLGGDDSGTPQAPVVYRAYRDEEVRLVGGLELDPAWFGPVKDAAILNRLAEDVRDKVRQVDLKAHGIADYGELGSLAGGIEFFCNGRRLPLARWPNEGWAEARSAKTVGLSEEAAIRLAEERKLGNVLAFRYEGEGPRRWGSLENVWIRGIWQQEYWLEGWNPDGFDPDKRELTMAFQAFPNLREWRRFYAANVLEEIDSPGEWYLDRDKGVLYILPPRKTGTVPSESASSPTRTRRDCPRFPAPVTASTLEATMISLSDTSYVTIQGLTLEVMRGLAVSMGGGTRNRIAGCVIRHAREGVIVSGGTHNGVVGCDIYDLAAMGVRLSGGDRKTLSPAGLYAINNHIHHYARLLMNWQPGVKVQGCGNRVAHNRIHHAPQYAISYEGNDHRFEFNDMHDLCLEMSDVGVIGCGTDWTYRGNVIRHNFIHNIPKRPYPGVCGVYLDNCASCAWVFGNVFYDMTKPVMIGGGRDTFVENNIFIECEIPVYLDNRGLRWGHFVEGGPMYELLDKVNHDEPPWSVRYPKLARILDELPQAPLGHVLRRNVSCRSGWRDPEAECRRIFKQNIDKKYMTIEDNFVTDDDPGFVDAENMNFQLRDDSIVYEKIPGFKRIPFDRIGLFEDEFRATR